jgi:hypothetical protein
MGVAIDDQFRASEKTFDFGYKALQIAMSMTVSGAALESLPPE